MMSVDYMEHAMVNNNNYNNNNYNNNNNNNNNNMICTPLYENCSQSSVLISQCHMNHKDNTVRII